MARKPRNQITAAIIQSPTTRKKSAVTELAFGIRGMTSVMANTEAIKKDDPAASCVRACESKAKSSEPGSVFTSWPGNFEFFK